MPDFSQVDLDQLLGVASFGATPMLPQFDANGNPTGYRFLGENGDLDLEALLGFSKTMIDNQRARDASLTKPYDDLIQGSGGWLADMEKEREDKIAEQEARYQGLKGDWSGDGDGSYVDRWKDLTSRWDAQAGIAAGDRQFARDQVAGVAGGYGDLRSDAQGLVAGQGAVSGAASDQSAVTGRDATRQSVLNSLSGYGEGEISGAAGDQAAVQSRKDTLDRIMAGIDGYGEQGLADIREQFAGIRSRGNQDMTNRGLNNTTVRQNMMTGLGVEESKEMRRFQEDLQRMRAETDAALSGAHSDEQSRAIDRLLSGQESSFGRQMSRAGMEASLRGAYNDEQGRAIDRLLAGQEAAKQRQVGAENQALGYGAQGLQAQLQGLSPSLNASQFGVQAGQAAANATGQAWQDRLGVIEGRTDVIPTFAEMANLGFQVGRAPGTHSTLTPSTQTATIVNPTQRTSGQQTQTSSPVPLPTGNAQQRHTANNGVFNAQNWWG